MKKYRLLFILLAILMMFSCFATGCQPASASGATPTPTALPTPIPSPVPTPMKKVPYIKEVGHVNKVVKTETENISIKFDADVKISDSKEYPIVELVPKKITQEQVDNFINTFFPEREKITSWLIEHESKPFTKEDIEEQIALRKKYIADTKKHTPKNRKGKSTRIPKWEKEIERFKEYLKNTPDDVPEITELNATKFLPLLIDKRYFFESEDIYEDELRQANIDKMNNTKHLEYSFRQKYSNILFTYSIYAHQSDRPGQNSFQLCGNQSFYNDEMIENYDDIPKLQTTYSKAKKIADKARDTLELDGMDLYKASIHNDSYCFTYTYDVEGTNVSYVSGYTTSHFYIAINDRGIVYADYRDPAEFGRTIKKEVEFLPFQVIMNKACDRFDSEDYLYDRFMYDEIGELTTKKYDVVIEKVELGYMMISGYGISGKSYTLVPVWDFYGREDYSVTKSTYEDGKTGMSVHSDNESTQNRLLTINAINGQVIDRRNNYWNN